MTLLWQRMERETGATGTEPPYWAAAWAGGQAVARHVLDAPEVVRGRTVLDLATGSGLCAVAAALAGARHVTGVDVDPWAVAALRENCLLNGVSVEPVLADLLDGPPATADVVLAGDVSYERGMASRMYAWLRRCHDAGCDVLVGDPGRAFLPPGLVEVARYDIVGDPVLENAGVRRAAVYRLG
ncbi:methyltransferase [Vallicoccus soli]|uniref:Methyltransferase n=2 Tax=Vallicoccus soli TaxID=2339232 RepID=A0A3A3Z1X5_9ACTN|nr:methyltransferase [Vallicoccus soli]